MKVMSMLRYCIPSGGDILLNFIPWAWVCLQNGKMQSENNFLYHLFRFLYYNDEVNTFKQIKSKRTGQSPLNIINIVGMSDFRQIASLGAMWWRWVYRDFFLFHLLALQHNITASKLKLPFGSKTVYDGGMTKCNKNENNVWIG